MKSITENRDTVLIENTLALEQLKLFEKLVEINNCKLKSILISDICVVYTIYAVMLKM